MRFVAILFFLCFFCFSFSKDPLFFASVSSQQKDSTSKEFCSEHPSLDSVYKKRLAFLDSKTPMDLCYNEKVHSYIDGYLGKNKRLISRMLALKHVYFPIFEQQLDQYELPLELKYLAIVESSLNPRAKSGSGATGLWQFMYLTGKDLGLEVNSYLDERQDPIKSTRAACEYFLKLYNTFGDWSLVLAAYNGGPGYLQRKINSVCSNDFWELYPYLRKETRNYVPTFIAMNYVMNYADEHAILPDTLKIYITQNDTITVKKQLSKNTLSEMLCVNMQTIEYLNPSYKKDIFPKNSKLILPCFAVDDFLANEKSSYLFIDGVNNKEILINEERVVYRVVKGDYLGSIANFFGVKVFELKQWNNLTNTDLDIGDKLVVYIKTEQKKTESKETLKSNEYIIQPGDTLWEIAKKHKGASIWKIKSLNNLESDNLTPGMKIILPTI